MNSGSTQRASIVVSHERSGTHFLMNTLALNFGYQAEGWLNLDFETGINFYDADAIHQYVKEMHAPAHGLCKSHHEFPFFSPIIAELTSEFEVFYIMRDPRDVLLSYWKYATSVRWRESAVSNNAGEFARSTPFGGMLRYQMNSRDTVLDRWIGHVEGWLSASEEYPVRVVVYDDLNLRFHETVRRIGEWLGVSVRNPKRPSKSQNVVMANRSVDRQHSDFFSADDLNWIDTRAGELLKLLHSSES